VGGLAAGSKPVDADIVREVGRDFDFRDTGRVSAPTGWRDTTERPDDPDPIMLRERGRGDAAPAPAFGAQTPAISEAGAPRKKRFLFF
jgi:hypothetical protein